MKVRSVIIHKLIPQNAWEQRILTQLGFKKTKRLLGRPQFLVNDSQLKRLQEVLEDQDEPVPSRNIVEKFYNGYKVEVEIPSKQIIELCTE